MYKFLLSLLLFIFATAVANSAIRTVSNNPNIPAQYTNLQTAINESNVGDTIYVSWSVTSYGSITLPKRLVIIGDGYNQGLAGRSATLGILNLGQTDNSNNCSNSIIQGLNIQAFTSAIPAGGNKIENMVFIRCQFREVSYFYNTTTSGHHLHSDWYFKDCIFLSNIYFANSAPNRYNGATSIIFSNCTFLRPIFRMGNALAFINCFFVDFWKNTAMFENVENAMFTSCIFLSPPRTVNNSTFNNCLTFSSGDNTIPYGTNTGENNIINQDPKFINVPVKTTTEFNYMTHNARLQSDSPAQVRSRWS